MLPSNRELFIKTQQILFTFPARGEHLNSYSEDWVLTSEFIFEIRIIFDTGHVRHFTVLLERTLRCKESELISIGISHLLSVRSFNQPKFCPNATWNPNATTLASSGTVGSFPRSMFITTNNLIVVPNRSNGQIIVWSNGSSNPTSIIPANLSDPWSVFVTNDNQIFVDNNSPNNRIDKWALNMTLFDSPMSIGTQCAGLFVDINNDLYCAQDNRHQVLKKSLNDPTKATIIAAGTSCNGSGSYTLSFPNGIFVTENLDLYVADWGNNRIQLFRSGELNGTTVTGNGSIGTIALYHPTSIVLDTDGYLFIADSGNNRIVGSGPYGFRCLVGCSGSAGVLSNQLNTPRLLSFDIHGNIFVADSSNNRIQTFLLLSNTCGKWGRNNGDEAHLSTLPSSNRASLRAVGGGRRIYCLDITEGEMKIRPKSLRQG